MWAVSAVHMLPIQWVSLHSQYEQQELDASEELTFTVGCWKGDKGDTCTTDFAVLFEMLSFKTSTAVSLFNARNVGLVLFYRLLQTR